MIDLVELLAPRFVIFVHNMITAPVDAGIKGLKTTARARMFHILHPVEAFRFQVYTNVSRLDLPEHPSSATGRFRFCEPR